MKVLTYVGTQRDLTCGGFRQANITTLYVVLLSFAFWIIKYWGVKMKVLG